MVVIMFPQHKQTFTKLLLTFVFLATFVTCTLSLIPEWTWTCELETIDGPSCVRRVFDNSTGTETKRLSPGPCFLTCGPHGALWPYPSGNNELGSNLTSFLPQNVILASVDASTNETQNLLQDAMLLTQEHILHTYTLGLEESDSPRSKPRGFDTTVEVHLQISESDTNIKIGTDESYSLTISTQDLIVSVTIRGVTFFGVRHGLETLTQLIAFNEFNGLLEIVDEVKVEDCPKFMYRGLLIDTGRNFIPILNLKKMVDAMAYNKLNMFHWHLSDSNSFPFQSKRVPQVTAYGTYGPKKLYTAEEVIDFVKYANLRGVKVIPELDAPSHAGNGWQWGPLEGLGELSLCVNAEPYRDYCIQPPCGQLNPLNPHTYDILGKLFQDLLDVFDRDIFHMGNDEISFKCWLKYPEILNWLEAHNTTDLMELWGIFQNSALDKLKAANGETPITPIVWTSEMTSVGRRFLDPTDYVIQIWSDSTENNTVVTDILNESYRVIFSNKDFAYLDHGYGPWRDNGFPPMDFAKMKYWQNLYAYDVMNLVEELVGNDKADELYRAGKILGGEGTLWSEKTDQFNMEMKLWPRSAALAERLWSNPGEALPRFAYPRLINHRLRMIQRGVQPDTLLPESCHFIMGFCD